MKYTKIEKVGNNSIEHIVEGDYEEVLAIFTEMNAKDAMEYHADKFDAVHVSSGIIENF